MLRIGEIVSSKAVSQWLARSDAYVLASRPHGRHIDPEAIADHQFDEASMISALLDMPHQDADAAPSEWTQAWTDADAIAAEAIDSKLQAPGVTEVDVARAVLHGVPAGGSLVVSSSMPVRDVEWFGANRSDITVIANRGANGIDGIVATSIGVAVAGGPTICLIGDVAFLHDSTALIALRDRQIDLTIVVVDNDGGGIFSFLPQHDLLDTATYEQLFGTAHGTSIAGLATAHGLRHETWPTTLTPSGVRIVVAPSERGANLALHDELQAEVASALDRQK